MADEPETMVTTNGVDLCVQTFGDSADPPVLLIGITMESWPAELCQALAGRYVIRYDLRDTGRSSYLDPEAPGYDLRDLVADASGLINTLGLSRAHVAGLGVGGFVAQLLTLDHPEQVASLTLVSTRPVAPGPVDADLPDHDPTVMGQLFGRAEPDWTDRSAVVDHITESARLMAGSRGFDDADARRTAGAIFDRARPSPAAQRASQLGTTFAAIDCTPRWRERLSEIPAPTLVVHGDEDPFFPYGNGVALANEIPDATLLPLPGIGQGLPRATWPTVIASLLPHTT